MVSQKLSIVENRLFDIPVAKFFNQPMLHRFGIEKYEVGDSLSWLTCEF